MRNLLWGNDMDEQKIKTMLFAQFIGGGGLLPPAYLDNDERRIWNKVVAQIELAEMDRGEYR